MQIRPRVNSKKAAPALGGGGVADEKYSGETYDGDQSLQGCMLACGRTLTKRHPHALCKTCWDGWIDNTRRCRATDRRAVTVITGGARLPACFPLPAGAGAVGLAVLCLSFSSEKERHRDPLDPYSCRCLVELSLKPVAGATLCGAAPAAGMLG